MPRRSRSVFDKLGIDPLVVPRGTPEKRQAAELVANLKFAQRSSNFLFRGLDRADYELKPSISRSRNNGATYDPTDEKILLKIIQTEGMMFTDRSDLSDLDLLALAQHFGAPTRLLDWTTNPLVALYFAIFTGKKIDEDIDGVVYIYKSQNEEYVREKCNLNTTDNKKPLFPERIFSGKVRFIFPRFVDARIRNQNGLFSIQEDPQVSFAENCDKKRLSYMIVPKEAKVALARYLYGLGITHDFIMPGFAGFCETLGYRHHYNVGILSRHLEAEDR